MVVRTTSEVDLTRLARLEVTPGAGSLTTRDLGWDDAGHLDPRPVRSRKALLIEIKPGSLIAWPVMREARDSAVMPHAEAVLEIEPKGVLMPGPEENLRWWLRI
jgi:hypothetical protein